MSFFTNLGKGFVRSAVNQVGRDGGRVISNSIYGDAHATPIRKVEETTQNSQQQPNQEGFVEVTADEVRQSYIESGYKLKMSRTSVGQVIGVALLGIIPFFISAFAFVFAALRRVWYFFSDDAIYAKRAMVAQKVPDKRYSLGYRVEGYKKGWDEIRIPPTFGERFGHLIIASIYAIIAVGLFYWSFWVMQQANMEDTTTQTEQVATE